MNKLSVGNDQLVFVSQKVRHQILYSLGRLVAIEQLATRKKSECEKRLQQNDTMKVPTTT